MIKVIGELTFIAESWQKSGAWGHKGSVHYKGCIVAESKIRYYNRTWERYQYESLLIGLVDKMDISKIVPLADRLLAYNTIKE